MSLEPLTKRKPYNRDYAYIRLELIKILATRGYKMIPSVQDISDENVKNYKRFDKGTTSIAIYKIDNEEYIEIIGDGYNLGANLKDVKISEIKTLDIIINDFNLVIFL